MGCDRHLPPCLPSASRGPACSRQRLSALCARPQGVTWRRFLVLLHHTPGKYSRKGLEDAMGICSGYAVECRCVWRLGWCGVG